VFDWDPRKAATNRRDHRVSFEEALTVFADAWALDGADLDHSATEPRWFLIGRSAVGRVLSITYTIRSGDGEDTIRLITARRASPKERRAYDGGPRRD
jgi:uncharacterized DUF497 family protein